MTFRIAGILILTATLASPSVMARQRHAAHPRQDASPPKTQPEQQPSPSSAASDYNNHVVENGMTQDRLDRTPVR